MPPVGRPRVTTRTSARPPVTQIGIADPFNYGVGINPMSGQIAPWHTFYDVTEEVPELMWPNSIYTFDRMRSDTQLAALLTAFMWGVTQLRFIIDPNGARTSLVNEISEDLNLPIKGSDESVTGRLRNRFNHHHHVLQAMLAAIYGYSYFEIYGDIVGSKFRLRKLFNIMPRTIGQINVDDSGELVNVIQWSGRGNQTILGQGEPIPADRIAPFIFEMEGYNWTGRSMLRDCFKDWVLKDRMLRVEAVNHERAGGVPYAVAPQGATIPEIDDIAQMMQQFRIGENAGGAVPYGTEINIARGTASNIDGTIARYDQSMARRFLLMVANLAQGGQHVGSYALGQTFSDVYEVGQREVAHWYCDCMNEFVIEAITDWNYGEDEDDVPKLTWEKTSEDALGVDQLSTLVQRGVIIVDDELEDTVRYKYQLPKRTGPRPPEVTGPGVPRQPAYLPPGAEPSAGGPSGAPSSGAPAITASLAQRLFRRKKPNVMAAPALVTVPNVEIMHAGWEYNLSTGPRTFTPEDLRDAVMAANEDPSIPTPRLKLGHVDPRFNGNEFDATPAFGKATNLRLSENGMAVIADYVGVPKWLAEIMPVAFPSRSIEGYDDVPKFDVEGMSTFESQTGKKWRFVITACSLLGVMWPGITVLEDLPNYYGDQIPEGVVVDPAIFATGGDGMKLPFKKDTAASANLDDVRRAFYGEYASQDPKRQWWWIQAILVDPNELVVEDDDNGTLYKIPFASDGNGGVSFTDPQAVRIEYVPDTKEANLAAASLVAASLAIGREVVASWSTREESCPTTTATGGAMDPKEIRTRLGLSEDASDDQVQAALRELSTAAGFGPSGEDPQPDPEPEPEGDDNGDDKPAAVPPQPVAVTASGLPEGMVAIDKNTLDTLVTASRASREFITKHQKSQQSALVDAAIADGRIAPSSRDHWLNYLDKSPDGEETLASLQPNLIPVELRGNTVSSSIGGGDDPHGGFAPDLVSGWTDRLFPEVANQRAIAAAAAAAGQPVQRPRITADSSYVRR
jgi:Protein of unknown function (DUF935)/Mu-like prophage I protein